MPLPSAFKALEDKGILFRRGQLVLVSAGPGTGKSALILTQALKSGASTLILSADSDAFVQLARALSIVMEWDMKTSMEAVLAGGPELAGAAQELAGRPIRLSYNPSPSLSDIETSVEAYSEVYGDYPEMIVVDNVTNVRNETATDEGDPFSGLEGLMDYLHTMARATEACVVGLHHVTGGFNDSDKPVPMSGVKGQITRVPEMVLTLFKPGPNAIGVSAVKNRGGRMDTSGQSYAELEFIGDRMLIRDPQINTQPELVAGYEDRRQRELNEDPFG